MAIGQLVRSIKKDGLHSCLYHLTDKANQDSIKNHGILSTDERTRQNITPEFRGGNPISYRADTINDITGFVCLSFTRDHPIYSWVENDDRLPEPLCLGIRPEILFHNGVMFADGVANSSKTTLTLIAEAIKKKKIDLQALYTKIDQQDPNQQDPKRKNRLYLAKRTEILVPVCVPQNMIIWDI